MRPNEGAGRPLGGDRESARLTRDSAIIPLPPRLGNCINCGQHIRLFGGATTCATCNAWLRWYQSFRVASRALREVTR